MSAIFKKSGKQLDKFSQAVGERLFKEDATAYSPAFRDLESVVELRRLGTERLAISSRDYLSAIGKTEKTQDRVVLPVELLGLNQLTFGTDLGDSDYANSLASLGRAHCKIGTLTEQYISDVHQVYQAGLERSVEAMQDYASLRKKLDSRRLTMDSTIKKRDSSKKGDTSKLEDDVYAAVARFEETQEDVEARMQAISESDVAHHAELFSFLEAELNLVEQIREELLHVKSGWVQSRLSHPPPPSTRPRPPPTIRRSASSYKNKAAEAEGEEEDPSFKADRARSNSTKSVGGTLEKKSLFGTLGKKKPRGNTWGSLQDEQDGQMIRDDVHSVPEETSRPTTSFARSRSASSSVTLASFANPNVAAASSPRPTPPSLPRRATISLADPEPDTRQYVKATFQFDASALDELSLSVGEVVRIDEVVSSDWYIGTKSVGGARGLFPSSYAFPTSPPLPFLPPRPIPPPHSSSDRNTARPPHITSSSTTSFSSDASDHPDMYATSEGSDDERFNEKKTLTSNGPSMTPRSVSSYRKSAPPPPPTSRRQTITRREEEDVENPFS